MIFFAKSFENSFEEKYFQEIFKNNDSFYEKIRLFREQFPIANWAIYKTKFSRIRKNI